MVVRERCVQCLIDAQAARAKAAGCSDEQICRYVDRVKAVLDERKEKETAPELVSWFDELFTECTGVIGSYAAIKREFNEFVMNMEDDLEAKILAGGPTRKEQLARAIAYARTGNYIDFAAMDQVDKETFLSLFETSVLSEDDWNTYEKFYEECGRAENFLLIADNCGEVVIDRLFLRALKRCFPNLKLQVLVRGKEVMNDATMEDAVFAGLPEEAEVISNGTPIAGTVYERMSEEARAALDKADVVLSKGQGNYESMAGKGRHVYYSFLCKCEVFTEHFGVPRLTGMFISE